MLIILLLNNIVKLYFNKILLVQDKIELNGIIYSVDKDSKKNEGFVGFFDWLRKDENTIVGIRMCFFENFDYNKLFFEYSYIKPSFNNRCAELIFRDDEYDPVLSGDQDFSNNYIYKSNVGDHLVTFGLDHLNENEVEALSGYCEQVDIKHYP
jgi:hypothetical protein